MRFKTKSEPKRRQKEKGCPTFIPVLSQGLFLELTVSLIIVACPLKRKLFWSFWGGYFFLLGLFYSVASKPEGEQIRNKVQPVGGRGCPSYPESSKFSIKLQKSHRADLDIFGTIWTTIENIGLALALNAVNSFVFLSSNS